MQRVVRAAFHGILLAAGVVSGIVVGIMTLHSMVWRRFSLPLAR